MNAPSHPQRQTIAEARALPRLASALAVALLAAGCTTPVKVKPELPQSQGHLTTEREKAPVADVPAPVRITGLVPPPKPAEKVATYSVVVSDVPVRELLLALARDTRQNIDIHPGLTGRVTLNAINETLPAILERIGRQVDMRVRTEGATIIVQPDTPFFRVYRVNYVNMQRDTVATIGASGQIGGQQGAAGGPGAAGGGGAAPGLGGAAGAGGAVNASATLVRTTSQTNFWETLRDNVRAILSSSRAQAQTAEDRAQRAEQARQQRDERLAQAEAVSRAGAASTTLFNTVFGQSTPQQQLPNDVRDSVVINPLAGTVNVLATERQHQLVQQYLDGVTSAVSRQVLIEATIAEVRLNDAYQAGVDWSRLRGFGGFSIQQQLIGSNLGAPPLVSIGYTSDSGNVVSAIKLLQQFGNTQVLSSPKIMALNNQTSILRVTDNFVYFQVEAQQGAVTAGGTIQPTVFNTTAQTVPVGVVLAVTPQINDSGQVTLTVRPTITRVTGTVADPNPSLRQGVAPIQNLVPVIQTRELESVLQVISGQTVILGGLMQDDVSRNRDGVPWLSRQPGIGDLFSFRNERATKTELVIFIRPTVVTNPSLQSDELKFFQRFLPQGDAGPSPRPVGAPAASVRAAPAN
ncbi:MAG: secretin N-terminal domain-containing protein [Burkholderiales bacterium]|nr:secretin N-terminal domain-containing protein [Burkholderiales bacterium]